MASTPQQVLIVNSYIRPLADRAGQFYNICKSLQAKALAEGWATQFPADGVVVTDGAATDGRTIITNTDVSQFITFIGAQITAYEATSNANRNLVMKIAVNPAKGL